MFLFGYGCLCAVSFYDGRRDCCDLGNLFVAAPIRQRRRGAVCDVLYIRRLYANRYRQLCCRLLICGDRGLIQFQTSHSINAALFPFLLRRRFIVGQRLADCEGRVSILFRFLSRFRLRLIFCGSFRVFCRGILGLFPGKFFRVL